MRGGGFGSANSVVNAHGITADWVKRAGAMGSAAEKAIS